MTNEQIKAIIDNAPEHATHCDDDNHYWHNSTAGYWLCCEDGSKTANAVIGNNICSLADLREILKLREENEAMRDILRDAIGLMRSTGVTSGWHQVASVAESLVNSKLTTEKE